MSATKRTKRQQFEILRGQLDTERATFIPHWRDLSDHILPRRARFTLSDINKGDKRNTKIIDSTATLSARTLRSGMMSGVTSPARPWFRLTTPDPDLAEFGRVKEWLHNTQTTMMTSFLRSNIYNTLPITYGDLGVFGTSPLSVEEDFTGEVMHTSSFPVGSYMIAKDHKGKVNTFIRDFRMTAAQLIEKFGQVDAAGRPDWSKFSNSVRTAFENGNYQQWFDVTHVIMPNPEFDPNKMESKFKKFTSCYYERGNATGNNGQDVFLRESGYDYFPILCPRWEVTGEDVYGTDCPGMTALGDIRQLQLGEKRSFEAIEKMVRPPMTGPTSLKGQSASILPGDITWVDVREGQQGFRPAHEVNFRIQEMEMKQDQVRNRIQRAFFEDLFLMLANSDRRQITAREIEERHEEKLLALGPVLEQLNQDLLDPLIDISFDMHMRQELLPPPPEELQGMQLKVEYISVMAQAQKLIGIGAVERFTGFVGQLAGADPRVLKKMKSMQIVDVYADMTSVPPSIVATDDEVAEIEAAEAAAAQQRQQMEQIQAAASTAKDLSQADLGGDNALKAMVRQVSG